MHYLFIVTLTILIECPTQSIAWGQAAILVAGFSYTLYSFLYIALTLRILCLELTTNFLVATKQAMLAGSNLQLQINRSINVNINRIMESSMPFCHDAELFCLQYSKLDFVGDVI